MAHGDIAATECSQINTTEGTVNGLCVNENSCGVHSVVN
jgi:hypothetical protein